MTSLATAVAAMTMVAAIAATPVAATAAAPAAAASHAAEPVLRGIQSVTMTVADIDRTMAFYRTSVPFTVVSRTAVKADTLPAGVRAGPAGGDVSMALLKFPNMFVELMAFDTATPDGPAPRPVYGPGYTHICFQSPETAPADPRFRSVGLTMVSRGDRPVDIGGYGVVYAYGRDPDGIMIENETLAKPGRSDPVWVSHVAAVTPDIAAFSRFYTGLLGRPPRRTVEQANRKPLDDIANIDGVALKGAWFTLFNMELEVWQYVQPVTPASAVPRRLDAVGYSGVNFEVTDAAAAARHLAANGATLVGKPITLGGWRVQYARDIDGNLISVRQKDRADTAGSIEAQRGAYPPQ